MSERIAKLTSFLKNSPDDSFLKHALALEYIKLSQETEARKLFESVLTNDPQYTGSYYHLGKLLERAGEPQAAIDWYQKGMTMTREKGDTHAYNELKAALDELTDSYQS